MLHGKWEEKCRSTCMVTEEIEPSAQGSVSNILMAIAKMLTREILSRNVSSSDNTEQS
jgi:hypothetical protein